MSLWNVVKLCAKSFSPASQEVRRCLSSALPGQVRLHFASFSLSRVIDAEMQFTSRRESVRWRVHSDRLVFIDPVKASKAGEQLRYGPRRGRRCCFCCWFIAQTDTSLWEFSRSLVGVGGCCNDSNSPLYVNRSEKLPQSVPGRVKIKKIYKNKIRQTCCPSFKGPKLTLTVLPSLKLTQKLKRRLAGSCSGSGSPAAGTSD